MSRAADEFLHNMKLASEQQDGGYAPFVYGHIASYDPLTHRVRLVLPSQRDEDGTPVLTAWMPLGTIGAGAGWGIQIAPMGGATQQNPTGGELCVVQRIDRQVGVQAVASQVWNQVNAPPFPDLQPGEVGLQAQGGSSIKLATDKSITVTSLEKLNMTAVGDLAITTQGATSITSRGAITVNSEGDCTLNSSGNLTLAALGSLAITATASSIGAVGGLVNKLVTAAFVTLFNAHTHPVSGGTAQPPNQQMTDAQLTTVLEAE
jgi:hypothetical protein